MSPRKCVNTISSNAAGARRTAVAARGVERTDERRVRLRALVDEQLVGGWIQDKHAAVTARLRATSQEGAGTRRARVFKPGKTKVGPAVCAKDGSPGFE
eukprot:5321034-Prymnesium_polylepis.1